MSTGYGEYGREEEGDESGGSTLDNTLTLLTDTLRNILRSLLEIQIKLLDFERRCNLDFSLETKSVTLALRPRPIAKNSTQQFTCLKRGSRLA